MELPSAVERLRSQSTVIDALTSHVAPEQARWRPAEDQWSILEVVNHLADEETRDFQKRLDLTLHSPGEDWPGIDPPSWVLDERYNERDLGESLAHFLEERQASLTYLASLTEPDWERAREHPVLGVLYAGDLLASWVAHDLLHIRQLTRLHYQYIAATGAARIEYAGSW